MPGELSRVLLERGGGVKYDFWGGCAGVDGKMPRGKSNFFFFFWQVAKGK